jgi:hypothetical protein
MNSTTYWWQGAYECAVLETDPARMATLIDDALFAIEQRIGSTIRMDQDENEAIESARNGSPSSEENDSAGWQSP